MFHVKIKYLREKAGLSRNQLAEVLNVTYTTIANYETKERQPDLKMLKRLSEFFNVSIDYLLDVPFTSEQMMNDVSIYFEAIKHLVKDADEVFFKADSLSNLSKAFIFESIEFISSQIVNINDGES